MTCFFLQFMQKLMRAKCRLSFKKKAELKPNPDIQLTSWGTGSLGQIWMTGKFNYSIWWLFYSI